MDLSDVDQSKFGLTVLHQLSVHIAFLWNTVLRSGKKPTCVSEQCLNQ